MNTVTYSAFNENSKQYLDRISSNNQEMIILKNKKPAFKISPFNDKSNNPLKNSIKFEKDIISPINEKWDLE
jgi:hypothetical protein